MHIYIYNSFPETISGVNLIIKVKEFTLCIHIYYGTTIIAHTYLQVHYCVDIDKFGKIYYDGL